MRAFIGAAVMAALAGGAVAQTPPPGQNPGQTATDRVLDPTKPATVAPAIVAPATPGQGAPGAPTVVAPVRPARAPGPMDDDDLRALLDAARETAKASRESVDYTRVMPDILTQILAKLDKIEDKLDRIEGVLKQSARRR